MAAHKIIGKRRAIQPSAIILNRIVGTSAQWLRIQATSPTDPQTLVSQMMFQPTAREPYPAYGFVVCFPKATLADFDAKPLLGGFVALRVRPDAVPQLCLPMLTRLLEPLKGDSELDVLGTYWTDSTTGVTDVVAESVVCCTIRPA